MRASTADTGSSTRHDNVAQPELLMNASASTRQTLGEEYANLASSSVSHRLRTHTTTATTAFTLAVGRLKEAQQSLGVTYEEKVRKVTAYKALAPPTHVQSTILNSLLLVFSAFPDRVANDHALDALTRIDWGTSDADSCVHAYRALCDHVEVSKLPAKSARAVVQTKLLLAIQSGSLQIVADFLTSTDARQVEFPKGLSLSQIAPRVKATKLTLTTNDLSLRVGPSLFSSTRKQKISLFPLNTAVALIAKSRLLLLDSAAATPSVYSLKSQTPFSTLHTDERPIYMSDAFTMTIRCASKSMYDQQFTLYVYKQRRQDEDAVVHVTVNTRASLVAHPACRFAYNGTHLSCLFFLPNRSSNRSSLFALHTPLNTDALPRESHLNFEHAAAPLQRSTTACAPSAGAPYLALSFTKGYALNIGEVTILDHFQPFCVEMWVFLRHTEEPQTLIAIGDKSADEVFIEVEPALGSVVWKGGSRSTFLGSSFAWYTSSDAHTVINRWTHVALNFTGTKWELLLDHRVVAGGKALVRPNPIAAAKCRLGGNLSGFLAEVRVWHCCRTLLELQRDAFRGLHGDEALLCGYYPLNEGGGDLVADYSHKGAHALLAVGGGQPQTSSWSAVPAPPVSPVSAASAAAQGAVRPESRCVADVLPLAAAESSEDVLFTTTASSFLVACQRSDTIHVYQYDMRSLLLTFEHAIVVPKTWALLDVRGDVTRNTLMCSAAVTGPRTSLVLWELQCQGPLLPCNPQHAAPTDTDAIFPRTAWQVGSVVFESLAYYAERLIPLEMPPRYPVWPATMATVTAGTLSTTVASSSTPWPQLLVDRGEAIIPLLFRLAVIAATDADRGSSTMARDVCSALSVNLLLFHESASEHRRFPSFTTVEEMLRVMATAEESLPSSATATAMPEEALTACPARLRDSLVHLALQPFARETSLLQTCCRCFLTAEGTLGFIKKLSGKPRNPREETVLACLIDSFATLPAAQDLLKSGTDGQVVFDALVLDTLATTQTESAEPRASFSNGIRCLTVLMEVLLARCAASLTEPASPEAVAVAPGVVAASPAAGKWPPPPAIVALGEHCCKSLLKATRHTLEWGAQSVQRDAESASLVVRRLRKSHVGTLLPWLLLTLPSMPTQMARASLPLVRGCREALRTFTESLRSGGRHHREAGKAHWLSELRLILLHSEGMTTSLLTVEGLRAAPPAATTTTTLATTTAAAAGDGALSSESELPLDTQRLIPLLMGGRRKAGTERDLLIKNLEHGVGPISKVLEELQRTDMSALRIMRDEGTRKMELQIMAAFCALCVPTADLANASKGTLQPVYRHVVALRPWILAKRQESKGFTEEVANRARFLAMFEPCYSGTTDVPAPAPPSAAAAPTASAPMAVGPLKRSGKHTAIPTPTTSTTAPSAASRSNAIESTRRRWRTLFQTWRTARLVATMQTTRPNGDGARLFGDIKDVLRSSATPDQLEQIVSVRVRLAHQRLRGLLALRELVEEARTDTLVATTLLPLMAQQLCQWHYARDVECCSAEDHFRLQEAYFQLLTAIVDGFNEAHRRTTAEASRAMRREPWDAVFVSLLTCPFRADDLRRLRGGAFVAALGTLCGGLVRSGGAVDAGARPQSVSVAAFSRPHCMSLGTSGIPLLVSVGDGFGTAVGPRSCLTAAASQSSSSSFGGTYFEVHVVDVGMSGGMGTCAIGLGPPDYSVSSFPGFDLGSCALRLSDGVLLTGSASTGKAMGCTFTIGDVAGCGVNSDTKTVFWTRNGTVVATLPMDAAHLAMPLLHPLIGLDGTITVMVNLGHDPFVATADVIGGTAALAPPSKRAPRAPAPSALLASNPHWGAFCAFSLHCAMALAQWHRGAAPAAAQPPATAPPPSPTTSAASLDQLVQVMGLCFTQMVGLLSSLCARLFPASVGATTPASEARRGGHMAPVTPDDASRNALAVLQRTQTLTLLLAEVDTTRVAALAHAVQPLTTTLHQLVNDLLATPPPEEGVDSGTPVPSGAPPTLADGDTRLLNAAMMAYYLATHLTPPPPAATITGSAEGMLTLLLQLAGRVCIASREMGGLGAPPSPRRQACRPSASSTAATSAGADVRVTTASAHCTTPDDSAMETAEQAVWMAVALLQRTITSPSADRPAHSWQPVLHRWLRACLDDSQTASGRDVLLALTVLGSGPRLAVPGDTVPVRRASRHEMSGVLKWISRQNNVCQILDKDGQASYLPLRLVDVVKLDGPQSDFPQPVCAMHAALAQQVVALCARLWPASPRIVSMPLVQQATCTAALSLLSRCVGRRVVAVPLSTVRVVVALTTTTAPDASAADKATGEVTTPARCDGVALRFQKVLTESRCAALLQTNQMEATASTETATAKVVTQPQLSPFTLPATAWLAPQVTSSTTDVYRTVETAPYAPSALRISASGLPAHATLAPASTATTRDQVWDTDSPTTPHRHAHSGSRHLPFRNRRYGDEDGEDGEDDVLGSSSVSDMESEDVDDEDAGGVGGGDADDADEDGSSYSEEDERDLGVAGGGRLSSDLHGTVSRFDHSLRQRQAQEEEEEALFRHAQLPHHTSTLAPPLAPAPRQSGGLNAPDEFFFLDEYELLAPELTASRAARFLVNPREAEMEQLLQRWVDEDGDGVSTSAHGDPNPPTTTSTTDPAPMEQRLTPPTAPPSAEVHFDHSCLRLFASRDVGQYYTIDLYLRLRHVGGHQIIFVQQASLTRVPSAEIIARIHRGVLEFGWIESLPGEEATATVLDVCRHTLRPEDVVGRWMRLTFAQVGTVVSVFQDGILRDSHRMRPNVSSLLQEEFFLGGVPEDPNSSLDGSLRDFCLYDVALRPAVIDQLSRRASPLASFAESHLAVRLQVHNAAFVNTAPPPAAVLLDIAADGEVGNLEQCHHSSDAPALATTGAASTASANTTTDAAAQRALVAEHATTPPTAIVTLPPPVEEVDFGAENEYQNQYRQTKTSLLTATPTWHHGQCKSLDHLTADYSVCLRELMLQYGTRLAMELLVHAEPPRDDFDLAPHLPLPTTTSTAAEATAPTPSSTSAASQPNPVLDVLAGMDNVAEAVGSLVSRVLNSTDAELHALLITAAEHLFAAPDALVGSSSAAPTAVANALAKGLLRIASTPEKRATFESTHPIRSVISTHLELLPGGGEKEAEDFHVYLDPRCATSQGTYAFAENATMTELFYTARSYAVPDFWVTLPRLFMDIRADVSHAPQWGYKLAVVWQSEPQLRAARVLRSHSRCLPMDTTTCMEMLEQCARVNSGKSRRLALACLTELLVLSPPSPFPATFLTSLHALHLMAERLSRSGLSRLRSLHRIRLSQVVMECYLFYRDTYLCSATTDRSRDSAAPGDTPTAATSQSQTRAEAAALEWRALSPQEEQDAYQVQRQQRRLLYEARMEERIDLVTLDVSRRVSLEWTAHHTCVARSESGTNSLITNIALSRGRWYYEVKMGGVGSVSLGVYTVPPPGSARQVRASTARWYAFNGHTRVLRRPSEATTRAEVEEIVVPCAKTWSGMDTVGVVVDITARVCRFLVNGVDTGCSFSFATNAEAAVTAATSDAPARVPGRVDRAENEEEEDDDATFRLYFALEHGETATINFGGGAFDYAIPRHCLPVDPAHLGEESTLPYHQMRGFQDVALHLLEPAGAYPMPPFYYDISEPFADCPERQGPPHVSLHAPEAVQIHGLDAKNTGPAFHTVYADCTVRGGRWYYEVAVRTQGLMQIGWAIHQPRAASPVPTGENGVGVGDTPDSWAVDGFRQLKWHHGASEALTNTHRWSIGDVVGCALDLVRGTMLFTLNGRPLVGLATSVGPSVDGTAAKPPPTPAPFTFEQLPLSSEHLYVPCLSLRAGNAVLFNFGSSAFRYKPDGFNALGVPDTWIERIETFYANERLASIQRRLAAVRCFCDGTGSGGDGVPSEGLLPYVRLARFVDQLCRSTGKTHRQLTEKALKDAVEAGQRTAAANGNGDNGGGSGGDAELPGFTPEAAWLATEKLLGLTRILKSVFPFLAFGAGSAQVTSRLFLALRPVLFRTWRFGVADVLLRESNVRTEYVRLSVNRVMARSGASEAEDGGYAMFPRTIFGQTFFAIRTLHPRLFRTNKRLWRTVFIGEGAEDVGGPYREHITDMCAELMSPRLPFFVPSANHRQNLGTHRDAFVPASGAATALDLDVFAFVGRLMGSAIRSGEPLSLTFPPPVWKGLCGVAPDESDLQAVDLTCWQFVKEFRALASQMSGEARRFDDMLESIFFVTELCDGSKRELVPGGAKVPLTSTRLGEYTEALLQARLHEFDRQVAKMREGMLAVVPDAVLVLFTPAELEYRVCGQPDVSVDELREGVVYEGLTSEDRRVALLWQALEEATPTQRRLFLRFTSGRDRLPVKLRVVALPTTGDPDQSLVKAATCFFAIEIPDYSSLDVMKRKLYYSIENCVDMDTDFVAHPTDSEERPLLFTTSDTDRLDEFGTSLSESNLTMP